MVLVALACACDQGELSLGSAGPALGPDGGEIRVPDASEPRPPDASNAESGLPDEGPPHVDANGTDSSATDAGGPSPGEAECGSRSLPPCPEGEFCRFPESSECGVLSRAGRCEPVPDSCEPSDQPVCGCDNRTYPSACEAARGGMSVHYAGPCGGGSEDVECGGRQRLRCPIGLYCDHGDASCGSSGVCRMPELPCPREFIPVCGCNGQSYPNACAARASGVAVDYERPCGFSDANTVACGGAAGATCSSDEFCDYALGDGCDAEDSEGTCRPRGSGGCPSFFAPVCGCDGRTYGNICQADFAGVSIRWFGQCN